MAKGARYTNLQCKSPTTVAREPGEGHRSGRVDLLRGEGLEFG